MYWDLLNEEDKNEFYLLQKKINYICSSNSKSKFITLFDEIILNIKKYINKNDENDSKRSLVCGIIWINDFLAINTRQLIITISKCKSSINSGFQEIGYLNSNMNSEVASLLIKKFPFLKNNLIESRQWTLRKKIEKKNYFIENN